MKRLFTILAIIMAVLAAILSVLPLSNLAYFPAVSALLFAGVAYFLSKKSGDPKKIIHFIFLLSIISLVLSTYKAMFTETEVTNTEELQAKEKESKEDALEDLEELDLGVISID